jgi:Tfp pilus assembly protein PilN
MRAVNLLPRELQSGATSGSWRRFASPSPLVAGAAGAVVVVATLGVLFVAAGRSLDEKKSEATALRAEQAAAEAAREQSADTPGRQQREAAVASAVGQRLAWDVMLTRLAHVVPNGIQLKTLAAAAPGAASSTGTPAPQGGGAVSAFTLTGLAPSHRDVARLLTRLRLVPGLVEPQLGSSSKSEGEGGRASVEFSISAGIDPTQVRG